MSPFTNKEPMKTWILISGIGATIILFLTAFNLDKEGDKTMTQLGIIYILLIVAGYFYLLLDKK